MLTLDPKHTALILIDVQKGTLGLPLSPYSAAEIVATSAKLAAQARAAGALLVYVRVTFAADYADRPQGATDAQMNLPAGGMPAEWSEHVAELADIVPDLWITKKQWSAFHGTELDLQLRRRGITHTIFGGIATNFGVESSARDAWQNNYTVVIAEDACSSAGPDLHKFAIEKTLPRVSLVRSSDEIVAALAGSQQ